MRGRARHAVVTRQVDQDDHITYSVPQQHPMPPKWVDARKLSAVGQLLKACEPATSPLPMHVGLQSPPLRTYDCTKIHATRLGGRAHKLNSLLGSLLGTNNTCFQWINCGCDAK